MMCGIIHFVLDVSHFSDFNSIATVLFFLKIRTRETGNLVSQKVFVVHVTIWQNAHAVF